MPINLTSQLPGDSVSTNVLTSPNYRNEIHTTWRNTSYLLLNFPAQQTSVRQDILVIRLSLPPPNPNWHIIEQPRHFNLIFLKLSSTRSNCQERTKNEFLDPSPDARFA